ncbi:dipeptide ABC transporter ATP-binding protein [Leifsonia sp. A12D58]|uniref:dipeptide ABC transporter ATP-binding protein n=1 Tax=Leifsonia sp. A12D58 TaxID=3397674 RepID=UPI0039E18DA5
MSRTTPLPASAPPIRDAASAVVSVRNLSVGFAPHTAVVDSVSFSIAPGECLAIVGESGSGKSVTARSLLGLAGAGAWVRADELQICGSSVLELSERAWRTRRGTDVGLVLQDALGSLDPLRPISREIADSLRLHTSLDRAGIQTRVAELAASVGLQGTDARSLLANRSGELSGGQRQRALIASAIALDAPLLIADEPTTALDVTVQAQILQLLESLKERGTAVLLVSHDLAVVARIADRVAVMSEGRIVEIGQTAEVLTAPVHPVTQAMIAAIPVDKPRGTRLSARAHPVTDRTATQSTLPPDDEHSPAIDAIGLTKTFVLRGGTRQTAVDDISFSLQRGSTLGIVGESGSGKTTTARLVLALTEPDAGEVRLFGRPFSTASVRDKRALRARIGVVYQDPQDSFDPRLSVGDILHDAVRGDGRHHNLRSRSDTLAEARRLLDSVGLASTVLDRRPATLSGGQRQRVSIARALASGPDILVCDEPVSALDVTVQAQVLDVLTDLQRELSLSMLFISHDLGVIQHVSDSVAVMQAGRIVEQGDTRTVFAHPEHPYTRELLDAVPRLS